MPGPALPVDQMQPTLAFWHKLIREEQAWVNRTLMPLAAGYEMGTKLRAAAYRRGWLEIRRLSKPVVSVGNLSVGGTGKTPFVEFLAGRLTKRGWRPSILTRGYKRQNGKKMVVIEPGEGRAPHPRQVGDEPALLARKVPDIPIIVAADRYRAGCVAEDNFNVDVHILDDGYQHLALARDVDIVLLDATQELSDQAVLPVGRLREPLSALTRAHLVVITRAELADPKPMEEQVRKINPKATIFQCSTKLLAIRDVVSGNALTLSAINDRPVYAFCGIGNPEAFFADLEKWDFRLAGKDEFPDHYVHHDLAARMIRKLSGSKSSAVLVTTEKDALNVPKLEKMEIPLLTCVIQIEMAEDEAFDQALLGRLKAARSAT